jgi:hypothetical protein
MANRQLIVAAAFFAATSACLGCGGALKCGSGCATGSPYAFMKYDCACETCGPSGCGGCTSCGDVCTCGKQVGCGDHCSCGGAGCAACGGCTLYRTESCKCGPLPCLRWIGAWLDCAGCGECYWNEWYNDPPACAEPCDCYGNWAGPGHPGYFRAPYRSHHGWVADKSAAASESGQLADGEPSLDELDAAAASAEVPKESAATQTTPAVYDDRVLTDELQ